MPRWITITKVPFDYRWPDRSAITAFTLPGEHHVKDEVADFAVARGYATEGRAEDSTTRSSKGGRKAVGTRKRKSTAAKKTATAAIDGATPNLRPDAGMVRADHGADGAAPAGGAVGSAAGE